MKCLRYSQTVYTCTVDLAKCTLDTQKIEVLAEEYCGELFQLKQDTDSTLYHYAEVDFEEEKDALAFGQLIETNYTKQP